MDAGGGLLAPRELTDKQRQQRAELIKAGDESFDAENYERALDCYHRASVLDGHSADVWVLLGLTYANLDCSKEAWRSYKLALAVDPDHIDALWYAGEFLYNMEDFELARVLLKRYAGLEEDAEKVEEAEELLKEIALVIGEDTDDRGVLIADEDEPEEEDEDIVREGFSVEDEYQQDEDEYEDDELDDDELYEEGNLEDDEHFIASLDLQLTGMLGKCANCLAAIPLDAPYCYNCLTPHFYQEG